MLRTSVKKLADQARLEGKREGEREGRLETARALLKEKMTPDRISKITGLPVEEIRRLK